MDVARALKEANNLKFGSTHIVRPQDPKYLQQFGLYFNLLDLVHNLEVPTIVDFYGKKQ
jgi:hypothetical protein